VRRHDQPPLRVAGTEAAPHEAVRAAVELGVGEDGLDQLLASLVKRLALRLREEGLDPLGLGAWRGPSLRGFVRLRSYVGTITSISLPRTALISASSGDFRDLRHLRDKLGTRFKAGVLLYTGEHTVPFEDRLAAVPLSGLWSSSA
jgi:hypothetical protein